MNRYSIAIAVAATLLMPLAVQAQRGRGVGQMGAPAKSAPAPRADAAAQHARTPPPNVAVQVQRNSALAQRLQPLLPAGVSLDTAAAGFKNQAQFVAALHVSRNLNIPFTDLKDRMTGPQKQSLGSAIQSLRPAMSRTDVRQAVRAAESQAKQDQRSATQKDSLKRQTN